MGLMKQLFIQHQNMMAVLGDEPCPVEDYDCPEDHCTRCMRHFTKTNPNTSNEIECQICWDDQFL